MGKESRPSPGTEVLEWKEVHQRQILYPRPRQPSLATAMNREQKAMLQGLSDQGYVCTCFGGFRRTGIGKLLN